MRIGGLSRRRISTSSLVLKKCKRMEVERLWREFFADPSQWWDHRTEKGNLKFPDFKHKKKLSSLWLDSNWKPQWVDAQLAAISPGTLHANVFPWNQKLSSYTKASQYDKTFELFQQMQMEGIKADKFSFIPVISACVGLHSLEKGKYIHTKIVQAGFDSDVLVGNSLVNMYMKLGSVTNAWDAFNMMPTRNAVTWNAMILGYVKFGQGQQALELFQQMLQEGVEATSVTFLGLLNACAKLLALDEGRHVHKLVIQNGFETEPFVSSALVDMYTKCGSIEDARNVFNKMLSRDVVAWSAMILGYVRCGQGFEALNLYREMQQEGLSADSVTYLGVLNACASVAALDEGRCIHEKIIQSGLNSNISIGNSLVDMYAKCGSLEEAIKVFNTMSRRDTTGWNAIIGGYALHGDAKGAVKHFEQMCQEGVNVTGVTFLSLLSACNHGGLVEEGLSFFEIMSSIHNISPSMEHYACIIDLLSRSGHVSKAEELMRAMPWEPNAAVWTSLLGSSRVHGNIETGKQAAQKAEELDSDDSSACVVLSNIYAAAGKWNNSASITQHRLERHLRKKPVCTWIELNGEIHSFLVGDQDHPQISEIHAELERLYLHMEEAGHVPSTRFGLLDVKEQEMASRLSYHSEQLAIAYGLIMTPPGTPLHIFKNLRVCGDCHAAFKFISKMMGRLIVVRDANQFHHFKYGLCSCKDFW